MLIFSPTGALERVVPCPIREAHGLTLVEEDGIERAWIADIALKYLPQPDGSYHLDGEAKSGQVVKIDLDGTVLQRLERPPLDVYRSRRYSPTSVAVDQTRHGGSGDIWVADGYGESLVHRFAENGSYLGTISGEEGDAGRLSCPHSVFIDRRHDEPELYVADRSNAQVQVFGLDGTFHRSFGTDFLTSPSAFAAVGDRLVVAELYSRLTIVDADDRLVRHLGEDVDTPRRAGWPNAIAADGTVVAPQVPRGKFNSPHGLAVDSDGAVYVSEWLVGGRLVRLAPTHLDQE